MQDRTPDLPASRVWEELDALLTGEHALHAILDHEPLLLEALPELADMATCPQHTPYHIYDVLGHTARVVAGSPATSLSRWAALLHDVGKPRCRITDAAGRDHFKGHARVGAQIARDALGRLGAPPHLLEDACRLIRCHEWYTPSDRTSVADMLQQLDGRPDLYRSLLNLQIADSSAKAPGYTDRLDAARACLSTLDALLAEQSIYE